MAGGYIIYAPEVRSHEAHWTNHKYTEDEAYGNAETGREAPPSRIRHDFLFPSVRESNFDCR